MSNSILPKRKQLSYDFYKIVDLILRSDDFIYLDDDTLALIIKESDKESIYHVELPGSSNDIAQPQIWRLKAWKARQEYLEHKRAQSAHDRLCWDNLKLNLSHIMYRLSEMTNVVDNALLLDWSSEILRRNPTDLSSIGVELIKPYYQGVYIFEKGLEPKPEKG